MTYNFGVRNGVRYYDNGSEPLSRRLTRLQYAGGGYEIASLSCEIEVDGRSISITAGQRLSLAEALAYPHPVRGEMGGGAV